MARQSTEHVTDGRSKKRPGVEEQREIISAAAVELFAEKGTKSVSIAQICAHADVSRPTFYRCFPDKEALLARIYEEAIDIHTRPVLFSSLDDPEAMASRIQDMLDAIFSRAQLARLVFVESSDPGSPASDIVEANFENTARVLARELRKRSGSAPSPVYLKSVMAAVQWIVHDAIQKGLTPKAKRDAFEATYALVMKTLAAD